MPTPVSRVGESCSAAKRSPGNSRTVAGCRWRRARGGAAGGTAGGGARSLPAASPQKSIAGAPNGERDTAPRITDDDEDDDDEDDDDEDDDAEVASAASRTPSWRK
jgi:hypothetical protein